MNKINNNKLYALSKKIIILEYYIGRWIIVSDELLNEEIIEKRFGIRVGISLLSIQYMI
jgi:hypothetical protein